MFLDNLQNIGSTVKSDHIINLFQEVEGQLPQDHKKMTAPIRDFLNKQPREQMLYMVGRRTGIFSCLADLNDRVLRGHAEMMHRFI